MTERERDRRNLNPSKEARAAMWLYGAEYAAQGGGSMDFWDKLDDSRKRQCKDLIDDIEGCTWRSFAPTAERESSE